ncbi:MAG: EAL domain-containing protein [Chromatiales bacterium]|nr:EAL domain-containing protein [Chromatiales bacterium]
MSDKTREICFSFACQPIVDTVERRVVSFEMLVRGTHGEPAPTVLKAISENDRYIFDNKLRERAIEVAAQLGVKCNLNLNLLPGCLTGCDDALAATIELAKLHGIGPERLVIEVTETEIIEDLSRFSAVINEYRALGVMVAIDDFGSGYSGLNLLADFMPDSIKIDMSLIRDIQASGPRQAIVRGIVRTCGDLGIDVVAEGVETEQEWRWCESEGIQLFQGYFFAKPGFESLPLAFVPN